MNILQEATKRVEKEAEKLSINELLKIDLYTFKKELLEFYIKEIQKETKTMTITDKLLQYIESNGTRIEYKLTTHTITEGLKFSNTYKIYAEICGAIDLHSNALYISFRDGIVQHKKNKATLSEEEIETLFDEMVNG